jgi:CRISPR/Cas system-associated exonuclease Cas4 (RecB family)
VTRKSQPLARALPKRTGRPTLRRRMRNINGALSRQSGEVASLEFDDFDRVSPTDLRLAKLCPLEVWYASKQPFETAAPTLGLAVGQIVHAARQAISENQLARYARVLSPSELWSNEVEEELKGLIDASFERHYYFGVFGERAIGARAEWTKRLLDLERERGRRVIELWRRGLRAERLALRGAPSLTEVEWFDPELRMHGFCDELWLDGRAARPVELKTSPPTPVHRAANRAQVAAYGYLAHRVGTLNVKYCEVEYLGDGLRDRFRFGKTWENEVRREVQRVRWIRQDPAPPHGTPSREICGWCPFQSQCPESLAPSLDEAMAQLRVFDEFSSR